MTKQSEEIIWFCCLPYFCTNQNITLRGYDYSMTNEGQGIRKHSRKLLTAKIKQKFQKIQWIIYF